MIKLIDILNELGLTDHYKERKTDRVLNINKVIVPKEALGNFTLEQIQQPLIDEIKKTAISKLEALEVSDIPLSQQFNVTYKFFEPVLVVNGKQYPITILTEKGKGNFYYIIVRDNSIVTIVISDVEDLYKETVKHLERKSKDVPVKILEPEGALYLINLDKLMGVETPKVADVKAEDLPYKIRTDYRKGASFTHEKYGTGTIVTTSSGDRGLADSRGKLDWVEVDFGKPYLSGGKLYKTRKINDIYSKVYFGDKSKDTIMEVKGRTTLHVYDFDDTLANSDIPVYVKMKNGETQKLTSHEFAKHKLEPGDLYDFSEFNKLIKSATPIEKYTKQLTQSNNNPLIKTTILTARALAYPIIYWLKNEAKIPGDIFVKAVGGSDPKLKADWIEKQVLNSGYTNIKFVDDSQKNLNAVKKRLEKYNGLNLLLINPINNNIEKITTTGEIEPKKTKPGEIEL